jgi:hypothetical protein
MARYNAVLVRVWRSKSTAGWQWSGQLERIPSGEILHFSDPVLMLAYLRQALCYDNTADNRPVPDQEDPGPGDDTSSYGVPW